MALDIPHGSSGGDGANDRAAARRREEDRRERDHVDRELDRDFFVSELADLRAEILQLRAELRPLVQLTSELLQERYLRREED